MGVFMTIELIRHNHTIVISDIIGGYLTTRRYQGYSKADAIRMFKEEFKL